jgi:transketolase
MNTNQENNSIDLVEKALWVWQETLAIHLRSPETRLASSLSVIEIFVALYYGRVLNFSPKNPLDKNRDRCIISKGHGSICMYPILADLGFFPFEETLNVGKKGSFLGGIPDPVIPGYETVNGSLGHGLGVASGIALALKTNKSHQNVFVITGDGELHEGANWEAIMFASHHKLDNLNLIVDNNRISMLDHTENIVSNADIVNRLVSFGWDCIEIDGHDVLALQSELKKQKNTRIGKPKAIIASTFKGRGVPGLQDAPLSHIINPKPELIEELLNNVKASLLKKGAKYDY